MFDFRMHHFCRQLAVIVILVLAGSMTAAGQQIQTPEEFFGFRIGTDGELARYPRLLAYLQHLAEHSDRVVYEQRGTTTNGHPYALVTFSSAANLERLDELVAINHRLANPRGLSEPDALELARTGRPFYLLTATIHSTEVGNGQTAIEIAHRLATDESPDTRRILDDTVVLLIPSQNPDGQLLVIDHWYKTRGTPYDRVYPDLYHRYTGHDNNRDWFMFTQKETRLALEVHRDYKPQVTHDMHQMGTDGARMFVPPYAEPHDPNIHPIVIRQQEEVGLAMASALLGAGKKGVVYNEQYDLWTPARQYMVYHGQPRILTEIASARLADPVVNAAGPDRPLGPQRPRQNFPVPYDQSVWRLADIVDYGRIAVFAGLDYVARHRVEWMANFYRMHRDWIDRDEPPYAFVLPAVQRDPYETFHLLDILQRAEVEIDQARQPFTAGGRRYPAGSWVVQLAQPYGGFAKTLLERQAYPDLRYYPGGPPIPPYDVAAHTLGLLMGVAVDQIDEPVEADLVRLEKVTPPAATLPPEGHGWGYAVSPRTNAGLIAAAALQAAGVPVFRATAGFMSETGRFHEPGTWLIPPTTTARAILSRVIAETGLVIRAVVQPPSVEAFRLKPRARVGLWRIPDNMPGGWMMWLFEQYGLEHQVISSLDFAGDRLDAYDVIVLPSGTTQNRMVRGLDPARHDPSWAWAYGIGDRGWEKLRRWVLQGGTLIAVGSAVETARSLLDLPIEPALPRPGQRRRALSQVERQASRDRVGLDTRRRPTANRDPAPSSFFYCPGSLLEQEHDPQHPVGYGMPDAWPVFFRFDQAYHVRADPRVQTEVVSWYPDADDMTASGWLLGDEWLHDTANIVSLTVGDGTVVAMGSQVSFRAQTPATFKLLFNAIFYGPSATVTAAELTRLR